MLRILTIIFSFFSLTFFASQTAYAQQPIEPKETVLKAEVVEIIKESERTIVDKTYPVQEVKIKLLDGHQKDTVITIKHGELTTIRDEQKVQAGQTIVIRKIETDQTSYQIIDQYRLDRLYPIIVFFIILVLAISRWKGLGSLIGLGISLVIILQFIVPSILNGQDPLLTSIVGSCVIMLVTMYLAHGINTRTHIALAAICISLLLTGILSYLFVNLTFLTGLGSDDATSLSYGPTGSINFQGLLLGGIIIGTLGVLDDIASSLTASIQELAKANPKLHFKDLWQGGMRIGSEHIASLVNTLALAYAGAGLPLFLFIVLNPADQPIWLLLNSEMLVEEIIRTLAGSIGLILAMPITAALASMTFQHKTK